MSQAVAVVISEVMSMDYVSILTVNLSNLISTVKPGLSSDWKESEQFRQCQKTICQIPPQERLHTISSVFFPESAVAAMTIVKDTCLSVEEIDQLFAIGLKTKNVDYVYFTKKALTLLPVENVIHTLFDSLENDDDLSLVAYKISHHMQYERTSADWDVFKSKLDQMHDAGKMKNYFYSADRS